MLADRNIQMAGETEVKAEVRLRFVNTNNDRMTATRRLMVTKKKTALSLKTLEGTLSFTNDEESTTKVSSHLQYLSDDMTDVPACSELRFRRVVQT